jgi:hypothetical protein
MESELVALRVIVRLVLIERVVETVMHLLEPGPDKGHQLLVLEEWSDYLSQVFSSLRTSGLITSSPNSLSSSLVILS